MGAQILERKHAAFGDLRARGLHLRRLLLRIRLLIGLLVGLRRHLLPRLCVWLLRGMRLSGLAPVAVSLMAGGALGNLLDRLLLGYVQDMFELLFMRFYIFNLADVGVVCGAVLCGVSLLFRPGDWSKK